MTPLPREYKVQFWENPMLCALRLGFAIFSYMMPSTAKSTMRDTMIWNMMMTLSR